MDNFFDDPLGLDPLSPPPARDRAIDRDALVDDPLGLDPLSPLPAPILDGSSPRPREVLAAQRRHEPGETTMSAAQVSA